MNLNFGFVRCRVILEVMFGSVYFKTVIQNLI